ncbi:MAG: molybdenum cofactor guanylyltransferase [Promethearchaeota archaeon]
MTSEKNDIAILILIGGKSNRLGTEKGIIDILGKPLILYQIEILKKIDNDVYLVAHSDDQIQHYRNQIIFPRDVKFIVDDREFFTYEKINKPMLGIYSGFKELKLLGFKKAFVLSCDIPLIKPEVINLMISESTDHECVIPRWNNGFLEFFFAIYPIDKGYENAKRVLTTKNFGLINFIDKNWDIRYIHVEKEIQPLDKNLVSFININGPIDIYKVIKLFQS